MVIELRPVRFKFLPLRTLLACVVLFALDVENNAPLLMLVAAGVLVAVALPALIVRAVMVRGIPRRAALRVVVLGAALTLSWLFANQEHAGVRHRAAPILEALEAFHDDRGVYPDGLSELVEGGLLTAVPAAHPWSFRHGAFRYQRVEHDQHPHLRASAVWGVGSVFCLRDRAWIY